MKRALFALLALLLLPGAVDAQRRPASCCKENPFSFSPYVGAYKDAYDAEADGSDLGWMIGFKAGYEVSDRLRLQANLGYAEANDVGTHVIGGPIFDNEWVLLTGGGDFALVPGTTSTSIGVEAGVGWRRTPTQNEDALGSDRWGTTEVIVPSLTLRHQFSQRAGLFVTVQDYIFDILEGSADHSPALTLGLSFR